MGRVKAYWKVSIKALLKRASDLNLITPSQYKSLSIQYNKAFKGVEPVPIGIENAARLQNIVSYHRFSLGYSTEDIAKLLHIRPEDADRIYFGKKSAVRLHLVK